MKREKKSVVVGYIYCEGKGLGKDEKAFLKVAKKKNIQLLMFNISRDNNEKEMEEKAKKCDIIYNNSAEEIANEYSKIFEGLGKRVVDSSNRAYFPEDKWFFYLICKKNKIPTPETILISENPSSAEKELREFGKWPIIIKGIFGCKGETVRKADNIKKAMKTIKHFWRKNTGRVPLIAQEFIESPCYRITLVGNKVVQTAIKKLGGWKKTGVYTDNFREFKVNKTLEELSKKIAKISKIEIIGIDFLKKNGKWLVLEVNAQPGLDFFRKKKEEELVGEILDYLVKRAR